MSFEDCPICLNAMLPYDHEHPTQCENRCGFNFCKQCIKDLIASSKEDYAEASDGSFHVKVFLWCPNCRSDLSLTIRDTLLLRKRVEGMQSNSQHQTKIDLEHPKVQQAVQEAILLEALYLGCDPPLELIKDEEVGVEVCLEEGVDHQALRQYHSLSETPTEVQTDPTLCRDDIYYFLSEDERIHITGLMTSGDSSQVAEAAQILFFCGYC